MGSKRKQPLRVVHPRCAGIDVGKAKPYVNATSASYAISSAKPATSTSSWHPQNRPPETENHPHKSN